MAFLFGDLFAAVGIVVAGRALMRGALGAAPVLLVSLFLLNACLAGQEVIYSDFAIFWSQMGALRFAELNILYFSASLTLYMVIFLAFAGNTTQRALELRERMRALKGIVPKILAVLLAIFAMVHISVLDFDVVMYTEEYLFLASTRALEVVTPASIFVQASYKLVGVVAFVVLAISMVSRNQFATLVVLFPCLWFGSYEFAGHSRYAVVYCGVLAILLLTVRRRVLGSAFLVLSFIAFFNAMAGRASGAHGLSEMGAIIGDIFEVEAAFIVKIYTNLFEGVYSQGEVFRIHGVEHAPIYKMLSFSPFPSFIDGFRTVGLPEAIRFHTFVPMGATGEIYMFGPPYMVFYWSVVALAYATVLKTFQQGHFMLFLFLLILFLLCSYLQFTYPVRWVFRLILMVVIIGNVALLRRRPSEPEAVAAR